MLILSGLVIEELVLEVVRNRLMTALGDSKEECLEHTVGSTRNSTPQTERLDTEIELQLNALLADVETP
jgi:hypothetical protein